MTVSGDGEDDTTADQVDAIIYQGVEPTKSDHESVFGSDPSKGQHFTISEGKTGSRPRDE